MPDPWRNAIVRSELVSPDNLIAHPDNWRVHPAFQRQMLQELLDQVGWVDTVVVNQRTGRILDGHLRVELALKNQEPAVPVDYVDLSETEEKRVLAFLDPITSMALPDRERLAELEKRLPPVSDQAARVLDAMAGRVGELEKKTVRDQYKKRDEKPSLEFAISIGPYRFTVGLDAYNTWVAELYAQVGADQDKVAGEVFKRLGLDSV
ncbi:MAG: hypothetical protein HY866_18820 [Chloroflexi bacterium]|nr:hypothetical protein [Chloroflexota bacterium]